MFRRPPARQRSPMDPLEDSTKKPAICIIVENMAVPADRRVWQQATALSEAGYRVSVICPKREKYPQSRETLNGIEIYRYPGIDAAGLLGHICEYLWALV